MVLHIKTITD